MTQVYLIPIKPIGKPRMTQRDRWAKRKCVVEYFAYCDALRTWVSEYKLDLGATLDITFYIEMPKSWSKKKREAMYMQPHQSKPDLDNMVKAFCDALYDDDAGVYAIRCAKYWSNDSEIKVIQ
jgi:Holliday junction resolvase RusA-like endonuclease